MANYVGPRSGGMRTALRELGTGYLADWLNRCSARDYQQVICTTQWAAAEFRRIAAPNVTRILLGVDLELFNPERYGGRLERGAARRDLPVTFAGFIPDPKALVGLLACADVVIAPGPVETFGLAALEALEEKVVHA